MTATTSISRPVGARATHYFTLCLPAVAAVLLQGRSLR
jgi:hypothetical protein